MRFDLRDFRCGKLTIDVAGKSLGIKMLHDHIATCKPGKDCWSMSPSSRPTIELTQVSLEQFRRLRVSEQLIPEPGACPADS